MVLDYPYEKLSSISIGKPMMILRKKIPAETENRNVKTDKQRNGKPKKKTKKCIEGIKVDFVLSFSLVSF